SERLDRIRIESATWYAKLRDGNGIVVEVPTGCRDETAARQVLADLERKAERVRAGLITPDEARAAEHLTRCKPSQSASIPGKLAVESPSSFGPTRPGEIGCFSGDSPGFPGATVDNMPERAISSVG